MTQIPEHPATFFRLLELEAADVDQHASALEQLRAGNLTGVIVRGVYEPEFMKCIVDRMEQHDPPFLKTWFPEKFRAWFYGQNLNLMTADPELYFQQAHEFHIQMRQLFAGSMGLEEHLMKILSRLDNNRPYRAAPGPDPEQRYMLLTFRGHAEGGYIPAHCDNEQSLRPAFEHLRTLVSDHLYSMVLTIGAPDDGGALEIFDYRIEPRSATLMNDDSAADKPDLSRLRSVAFRLNPGDLIVVDSGRYLHRVTPVIGSRTRWTACSFMAHALERKAVYCWG